MLFFKATVMKTNVVTYHSAESITEMANRVRPTLKENQELVIFGCSDHLGIVCMETQAFLGSIVPIPMDKFPIPPFK